jgi:hypothetical protein
MTHRAEQILDAMQTALTGLASTGSNVVRGRVYPSDAERALSVYMGQDQPLGDDGYTNVSFIDRVLEVVIRLHAKTPTATAAVETLLNQSRAEVFAALSADTTLGLDFVISTYPSGDDQPELSADSDQPAGTQAMRWSVHYRHSITSAEV